jgi:hypothetical protein
MKNLLERATRYEENFFFANSNRKPDKRAKIERVV